jgi:hypothetical protein
MPLPNSGYLPIRGYERVSEHHSNPAIGQIIAIEKNLLAELLEELVRGNLRSCKTVTGKQVAYADRDSY